jgi:hypothetical protein
MSEHEETIGSLLLLLSEHVNPLDSLMLMIMLLIGVAGSSRNRVLLQLNEGEEHPLWF